jgi:hypothetical protein
VLSALDTELDEITKQFVPDNTLYADTVQGVPKTVLDKDPVQCVEDNNFYEATSLGVPDTGTVVYCALCLGYLQD